MICLLCEIKPEVISRLEQLEIEAFGVGGLNEWHLVPLIRHGRVFISQQEGQIVGAVQYMLDWEKPQRAYMFGVSVDKNLRGKGIGTELLIESLKILFDDKKIVEVELTVSPENLAAVKVYKDKLGFIIEECRASEYGEGQDRLIMVLAREKFLELIALNTATYSKESLLAQKNEGGMLL